MRTKKQISLGIYAVAFFVTCYTMTNALISNIAATYPNIPYTIISQVMTIPGLAGMIVSFLSGPILQKYSKNKLFTLSMLFLLCYFLLFVLFGTRGPVWMLFLASGIVGISGGCSLTLLTLLINDHFDPDECASKLGLVFALTGAGNAIVTYLGGHIAALHGGSRWNNAYYLGFAIIPALLLFNYCVPEKRGTESSPEEKHLQKTKIGAKKTARIAMIALAKACGTLCAGGFSYYYSTMMVNEYQLGTAAQAGFAGSVFSIAGMFAGITCGAFQKIFKRYFAAVSCLLSCTGVFLLINASDSLLLFYLAAACCGAGSTWTTLGITLRMMEEAPKEISAICTSILLGVSNLSSYACIMLNAVIGSLMGDGIVYELISAILIGLIGALIMLYIARTQTRYSVCEA